MNEILKAAGMAGCLDEILDTDTTNLPSVLKDVRWQGVENYLCSLSQEDSLTKAIYGAADDTGLTYPAAGKGVEVLIHAPVGAQTSKYHKETVEQHILYVFYNACKESRDERFLLLALLHDCGKKYTAATNKAGGLCFYGHDKVSAFLANLYLLQMGVPEQDRRWIVTAIYYHMAPKAWESMDEKAKTKNKDKLLRLLGPDLFDSICRFSKIDTGFKEWEEVHADLIDMARAEAQQVFGTD